ncbi:MAG: hypothetical protein HWQ41_14760 [Nostoc sp. NOS(2021)]|uniref:hypothetical protein n=1 Tax=Nostoc sp. NOS(2021) TaxID=2815407 RepID=UPI0025F5FA82|nr:hypothetical protein [Nostoc sp. NOS(2021)]MBN3896472.1 hypothetical protein [Nostoc sp. NOS(2021)]
MTDNQNQPGEFDAVLGGEQEHQNYAVVLGGLEGVRSRLRSSVAEIRFIGITQAANYGKEGLDLIIEALNDSSGQVRSLAYNLLQKKLKELFLEGSKLKVKQELSNFDKLQLFTTLKDWVIQDFNPRYPLIDAASIGYRLKTIEDLKLLLQYSQVGELQALIIKIYSEENSNIIDILLENYKHFIGLKALSISPGKNSTIINEASRILKVYPNLNLLEVRECNGIIFDNIQHNNLKTLIIDSSGLIKNLNKLELPGLEFLDLGFGNSGYINIRPDIDYLKRIFSGSFFHQVRYLGLRSGKSYNAIASFIVSSGILNRLIGLDLSDADLGDKGAETLFNSPLINRLHTLNVSKNRLSPAMVKKLSQLKCRVIAEPQKSYRYNPSCE